MVKTSWVQPFKGNLPFWVEQQRKLMNWAGLLTLIPVLGGGAYIHFCPEEQRRRVLLYTTNLTACVLAFRAAPFHSGLQMAAFGLSVRTLEFHPMTAMKRFLLPALPLGLAVMATRAAPDVPRLGIRYVGYSAIAALFLDGMAAFANAVPGWYFRYSMIYCATILMSLTALSISEEVALETGVIRERKGETSAFALDIPTKPQVSL